MCHNRGLPACLPAVPAGRQGSVLLYVVFVVILLSLFVAGVSAQAFGALNLADRLTGQLSSSAALQGGLLAAQLVLEDDRPAVDDVTDVWAHHPARFQQRRWGDSTVTVTAEPGPGARRFGLSDEERRLSLNGADAASLARLCEQAGGVRPDQARQVADAILDWRDEDEDARPDGAEDFEYRGSAEGYACKDAPFEHVEELLLVRGVTPELYQRLLPYVTVYGSGWVNLNTASATVLAALGLNQAGVDGFLAFRDGEDSRSGTPDDRKLISTAGMDGELAAFVPNEDLAVLARAANDEQIGVRSTAFRMHIEGRTGADANRARATCVIDRDGQVLLWEQE